MEVRQSWIGFIAVGSLALGGCGEAAPTPSDADQTLPTSPSTTVPDAADALSISPTPTQPSTTEADPTPVPATTVVDLSVAVTVQPAPATLPPPVVEIITTGASSDYLDNFLLSERDLGFLISAEANPSLHVAGRPGVVVPGSLPAAFLDVYPFIAYGSSSDGGSSYFIQFHSDRARDDAEFPDFHSISLLVNSATETSKASHQSSDRTEVQLAAGTAWLGADIRRDCGEPPDHGFSQTVLVWFVDDLKFALEGLPVPECDPTALVGLADFVDMANALVFCSGFTAEQVECSTLAP